MLMKTGIDLFQTCICKDSLVARVAIEIRRRGNPLKMKESLGNLWKAEASLRICYDLWDLIRRVGFLTDVLELLILISLNCDAETVRVHNERAH